MDPRGAPGRDSVGGCARQPRGSTSRGGGGAGGWVCAPGACVGDEGPVLTAVAGPSAYQGEGHGAEKPGGHLPRRLHRAVEMALHFLTTAILRCHR